jgi:hypothetical protein
MCMKLRFNQSVVFNQSVAFNQSVEFKSIRGGGGQGFQLVIREGKKSCGNHSRREQRKLLAHGMYSICLLSRLRL